jgi:hypothetical protein
VFVRVRDTTVVFFPEFVFRRTGVGIAAFPKVFCELLAFPIAVELKEVNEFLIGDEVANIFAQPFLPSLRRCRAWRNGDLDGRCNPLAERIVLQLVFSAAALIEEDEYQMMANASCAVVAPNIGREALA